MFKLVRSRLTNISCSKCDTLICGGDMRFKNGNIHCCVECPKKPKISDNDTLTLLTNDHITSK